MGYNWTVLMHEWSPLQWIVWQQEERKKNKLPWATELRSPKGTLNKAAIMVGNRA